MIKPIDFFQNISLLELFLCLLSIAIVKKERILLKILILLIATYFAHLIDNFLININLSCYKDGITNACSQGKLELIQFIHDYSRLIIYTAAILLLFKIPGKSPPT